MGECTEVILSKPAELFSVTCGTITSGQVFEITECDIDSECVIKSTGVTIGIAFYPEFGFSGWISIEIGVVSGVDPTG
jgi:hypothetical protein